VVVLDRRGQTYPSGEFVGVGRSRFTAR
jgi:hypothetical protein